MCGIASIWFRESIPHNSKDLINVMFTWAEKRGVDGTGFAILRRNKEGGYYVHTYHKTIYNYSLIKEKILSNIPILKIGDIFIGICRAAPETEVSTSPDNMQPIWNGGVVLVHNGAVSQRIYKNEKKLGSKENTYLFNTSIDSESIISAYLRYGKDIKSSQEYLSGGYAYIMVDMVTSQMYVVNDFKPLATGYIKGLGYIVASENDCLSEVVEKVTECPRTGMNVWEYYYNNPQNGPLIRVIDLDSGFERHIKYNPRYITHNWDSSDLPMDKDLCLVSASGGIDSSLTLAILKLSGYKNIIACHFDYGHRGSEAEKYAIINVCNYLDIPLKIFPLRGIYDNIPSGSMLTDENSKIITGTEGGLKTTAAWVPGRNMMFVTTMATFAESLVMRDNYKNVYILGGFLNLTESSVYPDNSEDFLRSFLRFLNYGTLIGNRFKPLYCLSNIMKSEQWLLIKAFGLESIISQTISCDRPIYDKSTNMAYNCSKNGIPACGSGLLSWWGSKMVGLDDMTIRNFYEIKEDYEPFIPEHLKTGKKINVEIKDVINRILLPEDKKENLIKLLK